MGKHRSWFGWVKKLFVSEARTKAEKKSKRGKWAFGRLKFRQYPALTAPQISLNEATEEQRKHALNVAMATAVAAEAAVAAAHAAAEVVRLIGTSKSYHHLTAGDRNLAAIKIQSAFRAHLARKALRALKGLVKLQAIVRGRAVRRQATATLKCLPSNGEKQSKVQEKRDAVCKYSEHKKCIRSKEELEEKEIKPEFIDQRSWDYSILSKEDMETIWLRKQEAAIKRERMMKYSYSHRESRNVHRLEESVPHKENGKESFTLEKGSNTGAYRRKELEMLNSSAHENLVPTEIYIPRHVRLRHMQKPESQDCVSSPISFPRRSFSRTKQNAFGDNDSVPNSPVFPTYMAVTESAKAKARSMSTPKQRVAFLDSCFDHSMPYRNEISLRSSYNGESVTRDAKNGNFQQLSVIMNSLQ